MINPEQIVCLFESSSGPWSKPSAKCLVPFRRIISIVVWEDDWEPQKTKCGRLDVNIEGEQVRSFFFLTLEDAKQAAIRALGCWSI